MHPVVIFLLGGATTAFAGQLLKGTLRGVIKGALLARREVTRLASEVAEDIEDVSMEVQSGDAPSGQAAGKK